MARNYATPGAYNNETDALPTSVVPVATAVPAFIGYTPRADYGSKSYYKKAKKIRSFADYKSIYMHPESSPPADPVKQYSPSYHLLPQKDQPPRGHSLKIAGQVYAILPDPDTIYHLYNAVRCDPDQPSTGSLQILFQPGLAPVRAGSSECPPGGQGRMGRQGEGRNRLLINGLGRKDLKPAHQASGAQQMVREVSPLAGERAELMAAHQRRAPLRPR